MKFSGVTILQGVGFSIFPIDFVWALQQCSATALPVIPVLFLGPYPISRKQTKTEIHTDSMKTQHSQTAKYILKTNVNH